MYTLVFLVCATTQIYGYIPCEESEMGTPDFSSYGDCSRYQKDVYERLGDNSSNVWLKCIKT